MGACVRTITVHPVLAAALSLALCACASRDYALSTGASGTGAVAPVTGDWKIEPRPDRITGTLSPSAFVVSGARNTHNTFTRPSIVQLMCFDKKPIVRFGFEFRVGSNRSAILEYRFDDKPGRKANAKFLQDYRTAVIEEKADVAQFLDELATSGVLFVRVSSLNAGRTTAEYRVQSAPPAIDAVYAHCPVGTDASRRRKSAQAE